jgi:Holliday junction DNA helicase RuvB
VVAAISVNAGTTRIAMLSSPLRSRFGGGVFRLEFYSHKEIEEIIKRSARILGVNIDEKAVTEIAKRSRFTPRTANYLLKRCRDFAQVNKDRMNAEVTKQALDLLGVDQVGLLTSDRALLTVLIEKFAGGPVGLNTLGAALSEEEATIEEEVRKLMDQYRRQIGSGEIDPQRVYEMIKKQGAKEKKFIL